MTEVSDTLKDYGGAEVRFDPLPQPKPIPKMPESFRAGVDVEPKRKH